MILQMTLSSDSEIYVLPAAISIIKGTSSITSCDGDLRPSLREESKSMFL